MNIAFDKKSSRSTIYSFLGFFIGVFISWGSIDGSNGGLGSIFTSALVFAMAGFMLGKYFDKRIVNKGIEDVKYVKPAINILTVLLVIFAILVAAMLILAWFLDVFSFIY